MRRATTQTIAVACVSMGLAASLVAAAAAPRLDPGNWRVRVSSTTNGVADPAQDFEICLRDELKDLAAYFAPALEGVKARCTTTRVPDKDTRNIARRLRCTGTGFTYNAETRVTIEKPGRFTLTIKSEAKTAKETGIVSASGEGDLLGPCKAP